MKVTSKVVKFKCENCEHSYIVSNIGRLNRKFAVYGCKVQDCAKPFCSKFEEDVEFLEERFQKKGW